MSKYNKAFSPIIIVAIVIVVVLLAALGWVWYSNSNKGSSTTKTTDANSIIAAVKNIFAGSYKVVNVDKLIVAADGEIAVATDSMSLPYKPNGYDYYVMTDTATAVAAYIGPVNSSAPIATTDSMKTGAANLKTQIENLFTSSGLSIKSGEASAYTSYTNDNFVCTVINDFESNGVVEASCDTTSNFNTVASKIKPLASVTPNSASTSLYWNPIIEKSTVSGYERGNLYQRSVESRFGTATNMYYKKGSEDWKFIESLQAIPFCKDFSNADIKNAFKGSECQELNGSLSTVQ